MFVHLSGKIEKGELMKKDGGKGCTEAWEALSLTLRPDLWGLPIRTEQEAKKINFLPRFDLFSRGMLLSYLRRSSCFMRLCFSLCRPSVTLYISLQTKKNKVSVCVCRVLQRPTHVSRRLHLFLLLQPGRLVLQHCQLVLGQRQLLAGVLQRPGQLVVGHLQFDVLHVALLLLAVQLAALEL